jgi:hypothetical protein
MHDGPIIVTPPTCVECGRPWLDAAERCRLVLAVDDDDRVDPGEAFVYCPGCAEQEFGDA